MAGGALATDLQGVILFYDAKSGKIRKLSAQDRFIDHLSVGTAYAGLAFGVDGRAYVSQGGGILAYTPGGNSSPVAQNMETSNFVVTHNGSIYATESGADDSSGKVWLVRFPTEKVLLDAGLNHPSGIALSPDGHWLAVAENKTHWGYIVTGFSLTAQLTKSSVSTGSKFPLTPMIAGPPRGLWIASDDFTRQLG